MDVVAGLAIGAAVGLLMGLSVSPVVGASVATLLALVVTFIGLGGSVGPVSAQSSGTRLVAFSVALIASLLLGVTMRTHEWLSPSPAAAKQRWTEAKFSESEAKALVTYERLGLLPSPPPAIDSTPAPKAAPAAAPAGKGAGGAGRAAMPFVAVAKPEPGQKSTVLFAGAGDATTCGMLRLPTSTPQDALDNMANRGGAWAVVTQPAKTLPPAEMRKFTDALRTLLCGP